MGQPVTILEGMVMSRNSGKSLLAGKKGSLGE
jgi:hypothetical protein